MIKIICGPKGTGKTKQLIAAANGDLANAKGLSVFITDTDRYMYDVNRNVKFIDVHDYNIAGEDAFCGFIKGVAAANHDTEYLYIDGIARISGKSLADMAATFYMLEKIANDNNITITITCSCEQKDLPAFVAKYVK
jgi:chromosomal replication initiation ATPase DnaA